MYSIGDVHPGMFEVGEGGVAVKGELYLVSDDVLARIEAGEPPSLYRGVVKLAGGCRPFGILYPQEMAEGQHRDISQFGDWRLYMRALSVVSAYGTKLGKWLIPLLPVTPDVDRPSTLQARFSDRAGGCAGAFGLEEVGFECCQAGWRASIRPRLRRIGGRAVAGARPAGIRRVVRRCRGSRRVAGACRCRAGCRRPRVVGVALWRRRFQRNTNSSR